MNREQMDEIMASYSRRRTERDRRILRRRQEILRDVEGYGSLEEEVHTLFHRVMSAGVSGEETDLEALRSRISDIRREQKRLMTRAGYSDDYLDPPYGCSKCRDTGYLEDGSFCTCLLERKRNLLYDQSNIRKLIASDNFDTLSYDFYEGSDLDGFKLAVRRCEEFCDTFDRKPMNLFFFGTPGCGKSFLSCCIADRMLKRDVGVIYYSSQQFFDTLYKQTFNREENEFVQEEDSLLNIPLLIIDDLGAELENSWTETGLFSCINSRQIAGLHTVISTNLSLDDLRERYRDRIFSRIMGDYELLHITGPDIRIEGKKRRLKRKPDTV